MTAATATTSLTNSHGKFSGAPTNTLRQSFSVFLHSFGVTYGLRAGVSLCARLLNLSRRKPRALLSLTAILNESNLIAQDESVRLGLFAGSFASGFYVVHAILSKNRLMDDRWNTLIAGAVAGASLTFLGKQNRRAVALYTCVRLLQCIYQHMKEKKIIKPLPNGDALLFALSSAQIMYAYAMRPETLPESFFKFIVKTGPIHMAALDVVRCSNRKLPLDNEAITRYLKTCISSSNGAVQGIIDSVVAGGTVPCSILHPCYQSCIHQLVHTFLSTARGIFPLYLSLTVVPLILIKFKSLLRNPLHYAAATAFACCRSVAFMASFVSIYQGTICACSQYVPQLHHRGIYYVAGLFASYAVFIEHASKRSELALYTLPRALDSIFMMMLDRKFVIKIPFGDLILFSISMSGMMYYFVHEPDYMPSLASRVLQLIFNTTSNNEIGRSTSFYSSSML